MMWCCKCRKREACCCPLRITICVRMLIVFQQTRNYTEQTVQAHAVRVRKEKTPAPHLETGLQAAPALGAVPHLPRARRLPHVAAAQQVAHKTAAAAWTGGVAAIGRSCTGCIGGRRAWPSAAIIRDAYAGSTCGGHTTARPCPGRFCILRSLALGFSSCCIPILHNEMWIEPTKLML